MGETEKDSEEILWGLSRSRALRGYNILYYKTQWEKRKKISPERTWAKNRREKQSVFLSCPDL